MQVAKRLLATNPSQRIIFASPYVNETLVDSAKQLRQTVELLQKPFELDTLVDLLEDKGIYEELKKLSVSIKEIKNLNLMPEQVRDLLKCSTGSTGLRHPSCHFSPITTLTSRVAPPRIMVNLTLSPATLCAKSASASSTPWI